MYGTSRRLSRWKSPASFPPTPSFLLRAIMISVLTDSSLLKLGTD